jgi:hypothetical protein
VEVARNLAANRGRIDRLRRGLLLALRVGAQRLEPRASGGTGPPGAPVFVNVPGVPVGPRLRAFGERQRPQGQDGIAREPCDEEGRLHRDWAERREDEHEQVESHHPGGGDNASTVQNAQICSSPKPSSHESMTAGSHIRVRRGS